jgi:SpoVK/Ycf46/Vps4 family AAA+-type ATPase
VALFAGAAGTGKTLAAVLLARALGSDLFKADLSALVSKWVGETEKHLDRLFREAELANAVLFFDEADALFGRRGEIREARDRWANLEVNYLLQRIEDFDGGVILATNLKNNIDEAFLRRIETVVEFPLPDAAARARILETLMPESFERPRPEELRDLAAQLPLAGGNLKNIVVHASFKALAAAPEGATPRIARRDLLEGAAREYEKLGRPVTAQAFGTALYEELLDSLTRDASRGIGP